MVRGEHYIHPHHDRLDILCLLSQEAETDNTVQNEIDGNNVVQHLGHNQDQDARYERQQR